MENAEQTLDVLHKAKSASNIYNYPKVNLSPDEEISLLTSESKTNTNPLMQMMGMPDLISNPDPLRLNFLMYQQQQQMQQQMLHNYMVKKFYEKTYLHTHKNNTTLKIHLFFIFRNVNGTTATTSTTTRTTLFS